MSLELIRESIRVSQLVGEDSTQAIVENDIIVPDVKPDVARILLLDGEISSYNTEVTQERVMINGVIQYKILYVTDEEDRSVKSIDTAVNFSSSLDIPDARAGMKTKTKCNIEHVEHEILNGRKINVKSIVKIDSKVVEEVERSVITGVEEAEGIQVLRDSVRLNSYLGENSEEFKIGELLEVPATKPTIREILRSDVKITGKDYRISEEKIIAKGEINISTLYIGDDEERSIQIMEHEVPFTQQIDLAGVTEDSICDIDYEISNALFEAAEDSDGELRVLNSEVVLKISVSGSSKKSIEVVDDAFSRNIKIGIEKDPFKVEEVVAENKGQLVLKDVFFIKEGNPEIVEVFNILSKPALSEVRIFDDKVVVEGVVDNNVLYLSNSDEAPIYCYSHQIPFKHSIDIKGINQRMLCDVSLDVEHTNYTMVSSNEVEVRLAVRVDVKVSNQSVVPLAVKVTESEIDASRLERQSSITVYFAKPGDNLWKVAKKYYTTVDEIRTVNNIMDRDILNPGQQIIIPKKI